MRLTASLLDERIADQAHLASQYGVIIPSQPVPEQIP